MKENKSEPLGVHHEKFTEDGRCWTVLQFILFCFVFQELECVGCRFRCKESLRLFFLLQQAAARVSVLVPSGPACVRKGSGT